MGNEQAMLQRWKSLAGVTSLRPWTEDNMGLFFQRFRPDGAGVSAAFEDVEGGDEILPRLLEVYQATADCWDREDGHDGYFIVQKPMSLTAARATT